MQINWKRCRTYQDAKDARSVVYLHEWNGEPFYWGICDRSFFGGIPRGDVSGVKRSPRYGVSYRHWIEGCVRHGGQLYVGSPRESDHTLEEIEQTLIAQFPSAMNEAGSGSLVVPDIEHVGDVPDSIRTKASSWRSVYAGIMFVDLVGSTQAAVQSSPLEYDSLITEFQQTVANAFKTAWSFFPSSTVNHEFRYLGDEGLAIVEFSHDEWDMSAMLAAAQFLKTSWLISSTNRERACRGEHLLDVCIGLHAGDCIERWREIGHWNPLGRAPSRRKTLEGLPIIVAKRIEGRARCGNWSKIMVSGCFPQPVASHGAVPFEFDPHGPVELKGFPVKETLFELKSCWAFQGEPPGASMCPWERIDAIRAAQQGDPSNPWLQLWLAAACAWTAIDNREAMRNAHFLDYFECCDRMVTSVLERHPTVAQAHFLKAACNWQLRRDKGTAKDSLSQAVSAGGKLLESAIERQWAEGSAYFDYVDGVAMDEPPSH